MGEHGAAADALRRALERVRELADPSPQLLFQYADALVLSGQLDRALGVDVVKVNKVQFDQSAFTRRYDPSHPGANDEGYVLQPNVTALIESMDMREAQRTYEANLSMISTARAMLMRTIGIIN